MGKRKGAWLKNYPRKLLDAWTPPDGAGDPIGCFATTFTFNAEFFEEECLGRFARFQTESNNNEIDFLIEREEKLSTIKCASVLVDSHNVRASRSLRWNMIPARPKKGILHAKISLIRWNECARIILGSANLTEDGYRRNLEAFIVFDYFEGGKSPRHLPQALAAYCNEVLQETGPKTISKPIQRTRQFIEEFGQLPETWSAKASRSDMPSYVPILVGPGKLSAFDSIDQAWGRAARPKHAEVLSPFFDTNPVQNKPLISLSGILNKNSASVDLFLRAEPDSETDPTLIVQAPDNLPSTIKAQGKSPCTTLRRLKFDEPRELHAKVIRLQSESQSATLLGSSNFTTNGLGIGSHPNYEANLLLINRNKRGKDSGGLSFRWKSEVINSDIARFEPVQDEEEENVIKQAPLLGLIDSATYSSDRGKNPQIEFHFSEDEPPDDWQILWEETQESQLLVLNSKHWQSKGRHKSVRIPWTHDRDPSIFLVKWNNGLSQAWLPVIVENPLSLREPEALRNMSLELLTRCLTSARPLHEIIREFKKHNRSGSSDNAFRNDPHKRVDTSTYLLQRTRRVSSMLTGLHQKLEAPVATRETLDQRLNGTLGLEKVIQTLRRESQDDNEFIFLIAELCLELTDIKPAEGGKCLPAEEVRRAILHERDEIARKHLPKTVKNSRALSRYLKNVGLALKS